MTLVELYEKELEENKKIRDNYYYKYKTNKNALIKELEERVYYDIEDQDTRHKNAEDAVEELGIDIESKRDIYSLKIAELEKVIEKMKLAE